MNSRERVLHSIGHKQPDKLPLDLGATPSSGISAIGYGKLKKGLGLNEGFTRVYDVVQQVAQPEWSVIDKLGVDVIDVGRAYNTSVSDWYDVKLSDGSIAQYPKWFNPKPNNNGGYEVFQDENLKIGMMPSGATFFDQTCFPYLDDYPDNYNSIAADMNKVIWQALPVSPWDHANDDDFWPNMRLKCLELKNSTDKALMLGAGCNLFEWGTFLRRIDNFLMDIYCEQEKVEELLDVLLEIHMKTLENICTYVGDVVDIIRFGDDLGLDSGPFFAPEKYRNIFKPRHKMMTDYVHSNSSMKTFLHSCGSIYAIMGDLIDAGFDVINPVQTSARDMDPEILKREFGKDITFWGGGCNTRNILNRSTPQEVYEYTKRMIEIFFKDGGFVFNQEHNIMPDVPAENMIAMYKAVSEYK